MTEANKQTICKRLKTSGHDHTKILASKEDAKHLNLNFSEYKAPQRTRISELVARVL